VRSTTKPLQAQGNELDSHNSIEESTRMRGFFSGRTDRTGYLESNPEVKGSIAFFLSGKSRAELQQIYQRLDREASKHEKNGEISIHMLNDGDLKSLLSSLGYKQSKGML